MKQSEFYFSFTQKLFLALVLLCAISIFALHSYIWHGLESILYKNLGEKALVQAKEFSVIPELVAAIKKQDNPKIIAILNQLSHQSDANFIVLGDNKGYRLYHSGNAPLQVPMQGGDNEEVLNGGAIISFRDGSLGYSLRGKAPIFDENHHIIGIISVGYLLDDIEKQHKNYLIPLFIFCLILFFILFIFSIVFSYFIKKQMFNLEPKEIALLVKKQKAIMESIYEGLIAIDLNYKITSINKAARQILAIKENSSSIIGKKINLYIPECQQLLDKPQDFHDKIYYLSDKIVIINLVRITLDSKILGWVLSLRNKEDISLLSTQLSQVQQYADNLRTLRHEHLNWLATLSGMLYMKRYDEAQAFIALQSSANQDCIDFITQHIKIPNTCGLLIGKWSKAHELGLRLVFDPACQLLSVPSRLSVTEFNSIIGNLIDNAYNASLNNPNGSNEVHLYLSDATDEIVIEVSDNGCGIDPSLHEMIFQQGITSQDPKNHGIGLYLVATYVQKAMGMITFNDNLPEGTIFSVFIPKIATKEAINEKN